ncbi:transmembrane protein 179 isoform X2 [Biomphalaria pfeifferi]|uniref:Transmembrane protein 179 isoform X2 n=1 Tax=Biomphalaria pfeifferi TaxID=112525 RepID=A0AAD8FDF8_BIOPF|nr:transmembrane protein 179 isoform X2 [Biomphalaria pfeifferi]
MRLSDIFTLNNASLARLVLYSALFCFSFFIFVGVAIVKSEANGSCPLFLNYRYSTVSLCNYPMVIAIIFQLWYSLVRLVYLVLFKLGKLPNPFPTHFNLIEFICLCVDAGSLILTFIAAIILSAGYNTTCSNHNKICDDLRWAHAARVAQAGAWISTILWIVLITMCAITLWRAGVLPWMIKNPASSSAPTNQQIPTNHQVPQISTLAADTYQPTAIPGKTFETTTDNPYEPDF